DRSAESPFEVAATALLPEEINRLLAPLDDREREILKLRFGLDRGEPRTLEEVGEHFNLTRERIRQIEARAMSKLRHPSSDTGARDLLAVCHRSAASVNEKCRGLPPPALTFLGSDGSHRSAEGVDRQALGRRGGRELLEHSRARLGMGPGVRPGVAQALRG